MKTKHTQGEWSVNIRRDNNNHNEITDAFVSNGEETICDCYMNEANAKLIASAPELLKALINTLSKINVAFDKEPEMLIELGINDELIMSLEKAIKKVTE